MLVEILALTLLQLAFGLAVFNLLTPGKELGGAFFALHGALAFPAALLAGLASGRAGLLFRGGASGVPAAAFLGLFLVSLALHTLLARGEALRSARAALAPGVLAAGILLASRAFAPPLFGRGLGPTWLAAGLLLGGLLFGAVVWAMNVGHWYLVSKTLPFRLLVRASEVYALLTLLRVLFAGVALGLIARRSFGEAGEALERLLDPARDGLFFASRILWGLLAPAVLAPFVIRTARMKANQAATGLLYVALVFVLVGELLATYLTLRSGLPA